MTDSILIPARFNGPPRSANGGYACGIAARASTHGAAEVSLRVPPPVDHPLRLERDAERVTLYDGDELIAHSEPATVDVALPEPVTLAEAEKAAAGFDFDRYRAQHVFPGCFTCGPDRAAGDGMRLFPGKVDRPESIVAWPWQPDSSLPTHEGALDPAIAWAALDCPSGWAWYYEPRPRPHVLGRLAAEVHRLPEPGERTVVAGWQLGSTGRKARSAAAVWSAAGELLAVGSATWIELSEEQFERFRGSVS
ncbi:MAG: hypothetical protein GEU86_00485 [Actinophytocola sp.]|nr:hypothetical protein [Actinophytocola sp.]